MKLVALGLATCAVALITYIVWCNARPAFTVAVGTPIRHDDFLFTVTAVRRIPLSDSFTEYHVDVLVRNEAMRVPYKWRDSIAYLRDASGRSHPPLTNGAFTLNPSESGTAHLLFRLRADSSNPLRFWDGIFMGDAFNGVAYAHAAVPLRNQ